MPFSWMRVPGNTSPKVRRCMGDDHSKVRFEACVKDIVADDGGRVDQLWFELNGTFAHVHFYWETVEQKTAIVFDLEADDVVDIVSPEELDKLARERRAD